MVRGRDRVNWNHTAAVLAYLCEPHRNPRKRRRPFEPRELHPYERGKPRPKAKGGKITDLLLLMPRR